MKTFQLNEPIFVGHDVWIGCGTVVLKGVHIGNGVIIGANSVFTEDVPDYAIFAGNPARLIRMRFDDEIVQLLLELRWWELTVEQLAEFQDLFEVNIVHKCDKAIELLGACKECKSRILKQ